MGLIHDRIETKDAVLVRWSRLVWFYASGIVFMSVVVANHLGGKLIAAAAAAWALAYFIDSRRVRKEVAAAKAEGLVTVFGRRFSIREPLTYRISRKPAEAPALAVESSEPLPAPPEPVQCER